MPAAGVCISPWVDLEGLGDSMIANNDRDPLVNIRNTNSLSLVMKNGRLYDANTLDEVYPRQRKMAMQQWMGGAPDVRAGMP